MNEQQTPNVQDHYPEDYAHCFGCGRLNAAGHHLKTIIEGEESVSRFTPSPEQMAMPGFVYGGLIASLIDCHSMATAAAASMRRDGLAVGEHPSPRFVTAALNVSYLRPTTLGSELVIRGRVKDISDRKVVVESTVEVNGETTVRGEAVAVKKPPSMDRPADTRG